MNRLNSMTVYIFSVSLNGEEIVLISSKRCISDGHGGFTFSTNQVPICITVDLIIQVNLMTSNIGALRIIVPSLISLEIIYILNCEKTNKILSWYFLVKACIFSIFAVVVVDRSPRTCFITGYTLCPPVDTTTMCSYSNGMASVTAWLGILNHGL